jgi:hypothetical protein
LRDRGPVVWGALVQANRALFDPTNPHTLAANVVCSLDPYFDGRVGLLADIAGGLFGKKASVPADRELREFVRMITDERARIVRRELPRGYCGGHSVYFATCFIQPDHLPGNCLTRPDWYGDNRRATRIRGSADAAGYPEWHRSPWHRSPWHRSPWHRSPWWGGC